MSDVRELLAEVEQRADAATPGPWERYDGNEGGWSPAHCVANDAFHNPPSGDQEWPAVDVFVECGTKDDAEFIAHARTDVPRLVAALRAVLDEMHEAELRKRMAPEMAWCSVAVLRNKITEALGGAW